jgi:hypothetical protein
MLNLVKELEAEAAFDPNTVRIIAAAFDHSWASVQASGAPFSASNYADGAREILSKYIIQAARTGERDQKRLCEGALLELARSDLKQARKRSKKPDARP